MGEPFAKHRLGVHHLGEARLVDLHGRNDRRRPRLRLAITHAVVGILERESDERFQLRRNQIVLAAQLVPRRDPFRIFLRERQRHRLAGLHAKRFGNRRPDILPGKDVAIGDVERFVARGRGLARPGNGTRQQIDIDKGLKFRIGGFAGTIIAKVGGVPQQIAAGDIYPALEKGTIEAAEWVGPYDDEKLGFVKVAKYYYYPGWWEGTGQGHNIMNLEKFNALPKHYQAAIETASYDTFTWVTGKYDYVNAPALKRLLGAGAILKPFPQEVLEACYNAANEIYADLSKTNPHFNKMYASLTAFRADSLAWAQVAELSYDSFMMRMRTRT